MLHTFMSRSMLAFVLTLLTIVLLLGHDETKNFISLNVVNAYPNEAGACPRNQPAVLGSHLSSVSFDDDTIIQNRLIHHGSIEKNPNMDIRMNGKVVSSTTTNELQYGIDYFIEVTTTNNHPFKGVLIRVESLSFTEQEQGETASSSTFTLLPLTNAQIAIACDSRSSLSQGVTHNDNTMKYSFSAELYLDTPTTIDTSPFYSMDITIVDSNNATESIYWYTQYIFEGVVKLSNGSNTNSTSGIVPTPSPTASPTSSPYPTYMNKCYVCQTVNHRVIDPTLDIVVLGEEGKCNEIEYDGLHGLIPPEHCTIVQAAVQDVCGCEAIPDIATPVTSPMVVTMDPTITALPTYSEKCYVCGTDNLNAIVMNTFDSITLAGITGTCLELHDDGIQGYIPPELCEEAQQQASLFCNCTTISVDVVLEPTKSPSPSMSPYPTYSEKCHVCHDDPQQHVTAKDRIISVNGGVGTCLDLEQQGLQGYIHPSLCSNAQTVAETVCDCKHISSPSTIQTFTPTTTPYPTSSFSPTFEDACYICGSSDFKISQPDTRIVFDNFALSCKQLEQAGLEHSIPPNVCPEAQVQALLSCDCQKQQLTSPTVTPSYDSPCYVCGDGMEISHPKELVIVGEDVLNCAELSTAGLWRLLSPDQCVEAMKMASEFCGCIETNNLSPIDDAQGSPKYDEKCNICENSNNVDNDTDGKPVDSTRNVRFNDGNDKNSNSTTSGIVIYNGFSYNCKSLQDMGDNGYIPPNICPALQEIAQSSCPCSDHYDRDDAPPPKSNEHSSATYVYWNTISLSISAMALINFLLRFID